MNIDEFFSLRRLAQTRAAADGSGIVFTVAALNDSSSEYISDVWSVGIAPGDKPRCLQSMPESCSSPFLDSAGTLYFLAKAHNAEEGEQALAQVWRKEAGGQASPLTDEALGVLDYKIAGDILVVVAEVLADEPYERARAILADRQKNGPSGRMYTSYPVRDWDRWCGQPTPHLVAYSLQGSERRDLTPDFAGEIAGHQGVDWDLCASGNTVALSCKRPGKARLEDSSVLVIDVASGAHRHLGEIDLLTHASIHISPCGQQIAAVRHCRQARESGAHRIVVFDVQSGDCEFIAQSWDVSPAISCWHKSDALLVTAAYQGQVPLFRVALRSGEVQRITSEALGGSHNDVSCVGDSAYGLRHRFDMPPEVFSVALQPDQTPTILSALSGHRDTSLHVESIVCEGEGETPVQYFFVGDTSTMRPTILWIHGGPVSSWNDGWHWRWNAQLMSDSGYNMLLANPRGSTGFGQAFIEGISGNQWGGACYHDLMAVVDDAIERSDVDEDCVIAMGGSFGGYMSNWIGTQSDFFVAIITHASLYRLSAFQGTTDYPAYWANDMGLYPDEDPKAYDKYSPHRCIDNWKTPVLITHGEKDYRVPISESLMLFEDLQRREVDVSLLVFPDENHWIVRPRNAAMWYRECLGFLEEVISSYEEDEEETSAQTEAPGVEPED